MSARDFAPYSERCVSCGRSRAVQYLGERCARCEELERWKRCDYSPEELEELAELKRRLPKAAIVKPPELGAISDVYRAGRDWAPMPPDLPGKTCLCPGDCNCRRQGPPWNRPNLCGCRAHALEGASS